MNLLGICLSLAAAPAANAFVPLTQFTLAWTHSIERVRWEEDYRVVTQPLGALRLLAERVRIKGSGAGMEPPDGAQLRDGHYGFDATRQPDGLLRLSRSEFVPDYQLCTGGVCHLLSHWLASDGGVTELRPCAQPGDAGPPR